MKFPEATDIWQASKLAKNFKPWIEDKKGGKVSAVRIAPGMGGIPMGSDGAPLSAEEIVARQKPLEKLQFWWKLADKKDRKAFQRWIDEN